MFADNFVGRQILAVMIEPIKAEFGVSDTAMGLISGPAPLLVYALLALSAKPADRMSRTRLLAMACLLLWAVATMVCGLAVSFWMLALSNARRLWSASRRLPRRQCRSLPIYTRPIGARLPSLLHCGTDLSAVIGLSLGAWVVEHYGWRTAFIVILACPHCCFPRCWPLS